jgi:hypothetical protein
LDRDANLDVLRLHPECPPLLRCGRMHCRYTGPFFLGMAVLVTAYAADMVSLGNQPGLLLSIVIGAGNAFIWWSTERVLGSYSRRG